MREHDLHKCKKQTEPMQKSTFAFPDYDSLWLFKNQTQAINVAISPRKNMISGIFPQQDVELAVKKFNAVAINTTTSPSYSDKTNDGKNGTGWLNSYSDNYNDGIKKLKKVVSLIYSLKLF
jgi:hypothetical protein